MSDKQMATYRVEVDEELIGAWEVWRAEIVAPEGMDVAELTQYLNENQNAITYGSMLDSGSSVRSKSKVTEIFEESVEVAR